MKGGDVRAVLSRTLWLKLHGVLALSVGLLLVVIGITGSVCVYRESLDAWLNPPLTVEVGSQKPLSLDAVLARVREAHPDRHGVWTLEMPRSPNGVITAWFESPRETIGAFYAPLMVSVSPYSGEVVASRFWGQTLMTAVVDWHSHLQLGAEGRQWLALMAVVLMLMVVSGLLLWWPGWVRVLRVLRYHHCVSLFDLVKAWHRWLGFTSAGLLLVLAFSGFHLAYPPLLALLTASEGMGHGEEGAAVRSTAVPNDRPVTLAQAVLIARGPYPSAEVKRISTPRGESGTYRVNLRQPSEIEQQHPFTVVWVDRWSGQIRAVRQLNQLSAGQRFAAWMWPLHTGEAFGAWGRFLVFLAGFMPLVLYVSGVMLWLRRRGMVADRAMNPAHTVSQRLFAGGQWLWLAIGRGWRMLRLLWVNA